MEGVVEGGASADPHHPSQRCLDRGRVVVPDEQLWVVLEDDAALGEAGAELGVLHGGEGEALVEPADPLRRRRA